MGYIYKKLGPFVTHVYEEKRLLKKSRPLRKEFTKLFKDAKSTLTAFIAILFMIGASCFIAASAMSLQGSYSNSLIDSTYFIGSLFFTSAAYGQYLEVINADITNESHLHVKQTKWIWFAFRTHNLGYLSSLTQLIGTLLFNLNTLASFYAYKHPFAEDIIVWIPNFLGSILFLLASFFAWLEIYQDDEVKIFRTTSWWIVWANNFGSLFFQISAIASFILLNSHAINATISLQYTLLGGVCFFIGAYLLIIEIREQKN